MSANKISLNEKGGVDRELDFDPEAILKLTLNGIIIAMPFHEWWAIGRKHHTIGFSDGNAHFTDSAQAE